MRSFSRMIFCSLAAMAAMICLSGVSVASTYEPTPYMISIEAADFNPYVLADVIDVAPDHDAIRETAPETPVPEQRSIADLKPVYAESYDTHGLNFIELRRRC